MEKHLGKFKLFNFNFFYRMYIGSKLQIMTTDLEVASEIMIKQFANFVDRPVKF